MTVNRFINEFFVVWMLILSTSLVCTEYVPVYIWETSKSNEIVPALPRISQETFKEIIQGKLDKKSLVVIFAEPNLSSEDFGEIDNSGNRIFSQLSSIKATTTYLPYVDSPIEVLKDTYKDDISQTTMKDFDSQNIKTSVLVVDLDDVQDNESRSEILQRHDKAISNIYKDLQEKETDVIAIYTAYHTSWIIPEEVDLIRQARHILDVTNRALGDNPMVFNSTNFLLYVSDTPYLTLNGERTNLDSHGTSANLVDNILDVDITQEASPGINMKFLFDSGYWTLTSVSIVSGTNEVALRAVDVFAPEVFSFQCSSTIYHTRNDSTTLLSLPGMQMQPFRNASARFGDPYYCVGFTTGPIWSGIFVTALLVTIMAIGLSMMMDIRTMDRFDDPKGKTIQINVSE